MYVTCGGGSAAAGTEMTDEAPDSPSESVCGLRCTKLDFWLVPERLRCMRFSADLVDPRLASRLDVFDGAPPPLLLVLVLALVLVLLVLLLLLV